MNKKEKISLKLSIFLVSSILIMSVYKYFEALNNNISETKIVDKLEQIVKNDLQIKPKEIVNIKENINITIPKINWQKISKESFNNLKEEVKNKDLIGYMLFDSGIIQEPICQTSNNQFYLDHDVYRNKNSWGTIFLNHENSLNDMNLIFYGHNSRADFGRKFSPFTSMLNNDEFYYKNAYFTIYFENEIRRYIVCYCFNYGEFTKFDHQIPNLSRQQFVEFVKYIKSKNTINTLQELNFGDRFVTLQTCKRGDSNQRTIVIAKEVEKYSYE